MSKKVCFIATIAKTVEWFMLEPAKYLADNGYNVTIICNNDEYFKSIVPDNIRYIPITMSRGIHFSGIKSTFKLISVFRKERFDLIQYTTPNASLYAGIAGKLVKVPVRVYRQWGMVFVGFHGVKRIIFELVEKLTCKISTFVSPDSYGNLLFCREHDFYKENKSAVVWNGSAAGVNLKRFDSTKKEQWRQEIRSKYNVPSDAFVLGFVGRINRDKGINELLSAYKKIHASVANTRLFIVGLADREEEIDPELIKWAYSCEDVIFTSVTTEVEKYYSVMDVFVLPSYREGFGSTVIEAEAMKVPVIVSDIIGPTEAMEHNQTGLVVPVKDINALYTSIIELYNSQNRRIDMGKYGYEFVTSKFDSQIHIIKNHEFIQSLLCD